MARVRANNPKTTAPLYGTAVHTNLLDRSLHFHDWFATLSAPDNPRTPAIWIQLHLHPVSDEYFNPVQTHFASKVRERNFTGLELYAEERVGECLIDDSFHDFQFSHICAM